MLPKRILTRLLQDAAIFLKGHRKLFFPVNRLPDPHFLVRLLYVHRKAMPDAAVLSPFRGSVHRY